jgi:uncharacterized membrane protein
MTVLVAIGYPDETTAEKAAEEARRLSEDLIIQADAIAVVKRDKDGKFHVSTSHDPVPESVSWGMFWGFLFGLLFFVPLLGVAVGAAIGSIMGLVEKSGIDKGFQQRVRDMLQPGTSALFIIAEDITTDKAVQALSKYGGTVLKTSMPAEAERQLQEALSGSSQPVSA